MKTWTTVPLGVALLSIGAAASPARLHDRTTRSMRIGLDTAIRVSVTVGDVTLDAWDRPEVAIAVTRDVPHERARLEVPVSITQDANDLSISITQRHAGRDARLRGSVTVHAPAAQRFAAIDIFEGRLTVRGFSGGLRARVDRGSVDAVGVSGPLRVETVIGDIRVAHGSTLVTAPVRLRTFNGDVTLRLRERPSNLRVLALSLGGDVTSDVPLTFRSGFGPRFGEATLGQGEPVVSLDAVTGNVQLLTR